MNKKSVSKTETSNKKYDFNNPNNRAIAMCEAMLISIYAEENPLVMPDTAMEMLTQRMHALATQTQQVLEPLENTQVLSLPIIERYWNQLEDLSDRWIIKAHHIAVDLYYDRLIGTAGRPGRSIASYDHLLKLKDEGLSLLAIAVRLGLVQSDNTDLAIKEEARGKVRDMLRAAKKKLEGKTTP